MRSDREIKEAIEEQLQSDGNIDPTDVAVSVKDGVAMLAGFVRTYGQKVQAEGDAKCVTDVVGVANDVEVRLAIINRRSDPRIAREAVAAVQKALRYSCANIKVVVNGHRVILEGMLDWPYQRRRADFVVGSLKSIRGVTNELIVKSSFPPAEIKRLVDDALKRNAEAAQIAAEKNGAALMLRRTVRSWAERKNMQGAA